MSFSGNGLLGPLSSVAAHLECDSDKASSSFAPNGLLSALSLNSSSEVEMISRACSSSPDIQAMSTILSESVLNALGGISTDENSLPETQDDDLPDPSTFIEPGLGKDTSFLPTEHRSDPFLARLPWTSVRATTFDGKSFHIKRKRRSERPQRTDIMVSGQRASKLLEVPIHRLIDELSSTTIASLERGGLEDLDDAHTDSATEDTLWVDKYRPERFIELIGSERVARESMAWVKQWDWCVFGKRKGKKRPRDGDENYNIDDVYHRPRQRFLLISGPPGLGKTTLAHVIAKQAGYEVMEINASDARSAQIVDDRIRPALESGTTVGGKKPVLVIIDEIDGATGGGDNSTGFVQQLVQLAQDRPNRKTRSGQKRDLKSSRPILRPIICICNDINASSLAKLRPHAYQLRFSRPADVHTVRRLREICGIEGLKADTRSLSTLVGVAKGDLRGCLNTLQFIKSKNVEVTETMIRSATVGMKEADTTITSALNGLFAPMTRKRVNELGINQEEELMYVERLCREVDACGKEDSIALGCFAHYATLRRHDANFSRYIKANEWLVAYDTFSGSIYTSGDFALTPYLPYMLVPFYPLFQERGGERIERSQTDWDYFQLTRCNDEIHKSLIRGALTARGPVDGSLRHLVSSPTFEIEFASYINRIISPPLRPVNSQVIKPDERALLSRLVHIMASLELRFVQERSEDGQLSYKLEPPIDVFVTYDGKRAADIVAPRYAVRHLVAGEIDALLLERQASVIDRSSLGRSKATTEIPSIKDQTQKEQQDIDKPPTDFFGRPMAAPSAGIAKGSACKSIEKRFKVTYRYTQGTSAAVRKPVKLAAFM